MKQPVNLVLTLMALCIAAIIGLQLFWNYQNYQATVQSFQHDINQTLMQAVDLETAQRRQELINQVKIWLADTSLIQITCDIKNRDSTTVFHINDRYPKFKGSPGTSFGIDDFKPKLTRISPSVRSMVIHHLADRRVRQDLQDGFVYYYTQRLGDSLKLAFDQSHLRLSDLDRIYRNLLANRGIDAQFLLTTNRHGETGYWTQPVATSFRKPYTNDWVRARFDPPTQYFVKTMKWVILATFFLVAISLFCFGYTAITLLSQHKLARLKDDFINNMSHELNTPLASIKITAEALKAFNHPPQVQKNYLDIITYQADKLTGLTTQILNANRRITFTDEPWVTVDVCQLLEQAIQELLLRQTLPETWLSYLPQSKPVLVNARANSLLAVFSNVLDNAVKYGTTHPQLTICLVAKKRSVEIGFADNGIGIPEEYRTKIFEPFFRIPRGNVHDVKGYGLGLSYVKQILTQHGGSIRVEANEPSGSLFWIRIPIC
ncbi:Adaptive-response sensory-kinase SasA [Dyadobacter sp. CECT 9623]|uniref:histidine kinase n=1 Tax=Dyadobacter linearis TaxID=2823330 RepID=A0ABN7RJL5_9BACT|nr:HAMP domain-containing sensor histidine kinase [Dyadobacter sp. CECT 9623]CAG5074770.1 Adaptive-response sensory-kinase SasA [Dyadobacter sp. CECT 9623]